MAHLGPIRAPDFAGGVDPEHQTLTMSGAHEINDCGPARQADHLLTDVAPPAHDDMWLVRSGRQVNSRDDAGFIYWIVGHENVVALPCDSGDFTSKDRGVTRLDAGWLHARTLTQQCKEKG